VLVLLCQGLLFENLGSNEDNVIFVFGILIVVVVSFCLAITISSVIKKLINPSLKNLSIPKRSVQNLPQDIALELFVLNSLVKMDHKRELEVNLVELKEVLSKDQFEELTLSMVQVYKPPPHQQTVRTSQWGDGSFALETVLPRRPSGEITPEILRAQDKILAAFTQVSFK
jgi:hypothetical protein